MCIDPQRSRSSCQPSCLMGVFGMLKLHFVKTALRCHSPVLCIYSSSCCFSTWPFWNSFCALNCTIQFFLPVSAGKPGIKLKTELWGPFKTKLPRPLLEPQPDFKIALGSQIQVVWRPCNTNLTKTALDNKGWQNSAGSPTPMFWFKSCPQSIFFCTMFIFCRIYTMLCH